ncbi:MAG: GNAT family N-acetyltransferase [Bacteroidetes bacterium]|nr:MAG: GNAT family N-acetyltransferase [Bacteroidota bacterium]
MPIITATLEHLAPLVALFDAYRVFYEKESDQDSARAFLQERITRNESVIFIALDAEGRQVGFTQLYPLFSSTRMRKLWLLNDLFVTPTARGKGYSKALIERAQQHCRDTDACALLLETAKNNEIGNRLYPQMGFALDTDFHHYVWENKWMHFNTSLFL